MKGALSLFAQDAESKLMLYTDTDILQEEADDQVLEFLSFWKRIKRGVKPTLVFDSRFTNYANLSKLNAQGIRFITLRRRGKRLLRQVADLGPWQRIHIPHAKRKYPNPRVYETTFSPREYDGKLRQVIVKGNGHEKPTFMISNDFKVPAELLVSNYARRWRVENGIAEAVKFFHLNALSSPILTKVPLRRIHDRPRRHPLLHACPEAAWLRGVRRAQAVPRLRARQGHDHRARARGHRVVPASCPTTQSCVACRGAASRASFRDTLGARLTLEFK